MRKITNFWKGNKCEWYASFWKWWSEGGTNTEGLTWSESLAMHVWNEYFSFEKKKWFFSLISLSFDYFSSEIRNFLLNSSRSFEFFRTLSESSILISNSEKISSFSLSTYLSYSPIQLSKAEMFRPYSNIHFE